MSVFSKMQQHRIRYTGRSIYLIALQPFLVLVLCAFAGAEDRPVPGLALTITAIARSSQIELTIMNYGGTKRELNVGTDNNEEQRWILQGTVVTRGGRKLSVTSPSSVEVVTGLVKTLTIVVPAHRSYKQMLPIDRLLFLDTEGRWRKLTALIGSGGVLELRIQSQPAGVENKRLWNRTLRSNKLTL